MIDLLAFIIILSLTTRLSIIILDKYHLPDRYEERRALWAPAWCYICCSFWISLILSIIYLVVMQDPHYLYLFAAFPAAPLAILNYKTI